MSSDGHKKLMPKDDDLPVVATEADGTDEDGEPMYKVWPAGARRPGNPPRWSGETLRKLWGRDG